MIKPTISFYTLGCRLNQSETAVLERLFEAEGYASVGSDKPADIAVINTCTVTENGDTDTRRLIHKINRLNPGTSIALIGCQAQVQKGKLAELPNVRWVVGNARKMELHSIIRSRRQDETAEVITPAIPREAFTVPTAGIDRRHARANIKIQDGCDFFCSFCEIPYARGRARSRKFEDILLEADVLAASGHKELVITGINVGTYQNENRTLEDVVEALEQINGLERIRISSIEPTTLPRKLLKKMAQRTKLCRHLHIPLQSGSDSVLEKMRRRYSAQEFGDFIQTAYETVPEICIGTDMIVGFPCETEEHFLESADCLKRWPIHYCHVFSYSQRSMARSQNLPEAVSTFDIQKRSRILHDLSQRKRRMFNESFLGTTQKVLFEQKKSGIWTGLTDHYVRVCVASDDHLTNRLQDVRLMNIEGLMVRGELSS